MPTNFTAIKNRIYIDCIEADDGFGNLLHIAHKCYRIAEKQGWYDGFTCYDSYTAGCAVLDWGY